MDQSTEEKIKTAARKIFHEKGYSGTRTRDIAEEAGINLALLNYYFRNKKRLFELVMSDSLEDFFSSIRGAFVDTSTDLDQKIQIIINNYLDQLTANPNIPIFLLNELRSNPDALVKKSELRGVLNSSSFMQQLEERLKETKQTGINPFHLIVNILGLTVFPFMASPMIKEMRQINDEQFMAFIEERRTLIPQWIQLMIKK
ncbi:TetR/AcrR family transcriptional regulator [Algoriphagus sp. PAP.12]|uniref:TetR/AcrR family transcriptional regulator n=1 Tax=Algoriphagus sp. PAP.12 TaxID=2996678 RepID=UPI00227A528E|nr:TetR/AcrR family transcriptional regulator [Algoriphagus sp. PAP.12]